MRGRKGEERRGKMKFKLVREEGDDKVWISEKLSNGDWPYRLLIKLEDTRHWGDGPTYHYHVSILAVSPKAAEKRLPDVARFLGMKWDEFQSLDLLHQSVALMDFGTYACLFQDMGDDEKKLVQFAKQKANLCYMKFGDYINRPQNAIGDTGFDWIKGETGNALIRGKKS
jgi:hypothetical protein